MEESVVFVKKKGIFLSIVQREGMVVLIVLFQHKKYECTKEGGGVYVDPVLKENDMAVTYVSGVRNLEKLKEKMRKENEEKARASEGSGVILTDSSSKNKEKEVEVRELSSFLSTLDEKGEGNFISNSSLTQETQNEREKLLSLSSKEGEGGKRLSSLTISNEKEVRFGKNLGSASLKIVEKQLRKDI